MIRAVRRRHRVRVGSHRVVMETRSVVARIRAIRMHAARIRAIRIPAIRIHAAHTHLTPTTTNPLCDHANPLPLRLPRHRQPLRSRSCSRSRYMDLFLWKDR